MTEKGEAELDFAADAVQAVFGDCLDLSHGVTTQVGKLGGFEVSEYLLSWIRLWCVARQAFD